MLRALVYAYVLGGLTFLPLLIAAAVAWTVYTSVPVGDPDPAKAAKAELANDDDAKEKGEPQSPAFADFPKPRKGWLVVRRTFEEQQGDGTYMGLMRSFLDARSKDPKRARPKDTFFVALKGTVLYLYEDEAMAECWAALDVSMHRVTIFPEGLQDGELFAKRNAICLMPKDVTPARELPSVTREMTATSTEEVEAAKEDATKKKEVAALDETASRLEAAREEAFDPRTPWFIFVRSNIEMEDWYFALHHAGQPANPHPPSVAPVFSADDMAALVNTLDAVEDRIPMRWLNALLGRIVFSYYRTAALEQFIISRIMKKLSKVKRPAFLQDIIVKEVNVGNTAPLLQKPMLKELTREGDASFEVGLRYKGEVRVTIETVAIINLGPRFKSYTVKLVLAAVLRELEGNLLVKVKRPPSNRIWYAFTTMPKMDLGVEPIVSDRQIKWSMILNTIESKLKEIILESVVLPNMDDIAFFDSGPYDRRGGIWEDALRPALRQMQQMGEDARETLPVPPAAASGDDTQALPKAASTEALTSPPITETSPSEPGVLPRAETSPPTAPGILPTSPPAQKTWFAAGTNANASTSTLHTVSGGSSETTTPRLADELTDESRGRLRTTVPGTETQRGTSAPAAARADSVVEDEEEDESMHDASSYRKHRQSSGSVSSASAISDGDELLSGRSRPTTPSSMSSTGASPSPRPSTFLSTLKARAAAAEKGPLATSAREAVKKWSATWGLKKDANAMNVQGMDDEQMERENPGLFNSMRSRYDEVRDAVASRRERERDGRASPSLTPTQSTTPGAVDIPRAQQQARPRSAGSDMPSSASPAKSGISIMRSTPSAAAIFAPISSAQPTVSAVNAAPFGGPSASLSPRTGPTTPDLSSSPLPVSPPVPIQKQPPKAASMIIPGIHQSHRNEPMAFGSAPAPPPEDTTKARPRPLSTATSTVYKLFQRNSTLLQSPGISGQGDEQHHRSGSLTPAEAEASLFDVATPIAQPPPLSPMPPPLPPRKNTVSPVVLKNDALPALPAQAVEPPVEFAHDDTPRVPSPGPSAPVSSSPASEALKSIVALDEVRRNSGSRTHSRQSSFQSSAPGSRAPNSPALAPTPAPGTVPDTIESDSANVAPPDTVQRRPPPLPPRTTSVAIPVQPQNE
ncbi:hypothetical protein EXIGLDRAFT_34693 [Exidia glandulosa HHB12029]|uniref:SMP-LTD domain-containing protein n=1 Tax=Exidia glandulosa HHB12029 TaxID=1314781 RepID=A0A165IQU1_EXIGL|nr:hypothetical protein EXIGLDRAFT_34693 [Exidia glandulosa HHB12029]